MPVAFVFPDFENGVKLAKRLSEVARVLFVK
jgi:hypothetical protein